MAALKGVYRGQITLNSTILVVTDTIPVPVVIAKSFIKLTFKSNTGKDNIASGLVSGRILNTTQVEFTRAIASIGITVDISWEVIEFSTGVAVQHGRNAIVNGTNNITISTIDTTKSFVMHSIHTDQGGNDFGKEETIASVITSSTNFDLILDSGSATVDWQVIEYKDCTVQQINASLLGDNILQDVTISTVVPSRTFIFGSYYTDEGKVQAAKSFRYYLLNSTTIRFERFDTTGKNQEWYMYIIQFDENEAEVSRYAEPILNAEASRLVTISEIASYYSMTHFNSCATPVASINHGDDFFDYYLFRLTVTSSTNITLDRGTALEPGTLNFQIINFRHLINDITKPFNRGQNRIFNRGFGA